MSSPQPLAEVDGEMYSPRDAALARLILATGEPEIDREDLALRWRAFMRDRWAGSARSMPSGKGSIVQKMLVSGIRALEHGECLTRTEPATIRVLNRDRLNRISDVYRPL
jgi:hypothetical protein